MRTRSLVAALLAVAAVVAGHRADTDVALPKPAPSRQVLAAPRDSGIRWDGSGARRQVDARGKAAELQTTRRSGRHVSARDDAFTGVADRLGVVCHRRQSWQAQYLRFSRSRYDHVSAGSRHGAARAGAFPLRLRSVLETEAVFDSRRDVVLGDGGKGRRTIERAHRARHVPA